MSATGYVLVRPKHGVIDPVIYGSEGQAKYRREFDHADLDDVVVARVYLP